ncbi:YolD-like family protein [bacterium]|nr:YolD-like family protein [bacterium]
MLTRLERAKLFAPFDAMKGLKEALRDREERHARVARHEISEEQAEENSRAILRLERGMEIEVYCHLSFHDVVKRGVVTDLDLALRKLKLNGKNILFDDIYTITIKGHPR